MVKTIEIFTQTNHIDVYFDIRYLQDIKYPCKTNRGQCSTKKFRLVKRSAQNRPEVSECVYRENDRSDQRICEMILFLFIFFVHLSFKEESIKTVPESPCSSDDKADWKADNKKWRGHTSSSSRDEWDDDEYRSHRSLSSHPDRQFNMSNFYMRHARRMNSCDDDYEYEDEKSRRRDRRSNNSMFRF